MMAIMAELDRVAPCQTIEIELEAEDRESLLVEWLNEILFLIETENVLFSRFDVVLSSDTKLTATIAGEPLDMEKHDPKTQIKAATLHEFVRERGPLGLIRPAVRCPPPLSLSPSLDPCL